MVLLFLISQTLFLTKKVKRKVQGVPQSQTTALPRPQEEEETDKPQIYGILTYLQ